MTSPRQVFTKDEVRGFVAELMKGLGKALKESPTAGKESPTAGKESPKARDAAEAKRVANDKAILHGELALEKRQHIKEVASNPMATSTDLVTALGGDAAVTPLQLARINSGRPRHRRFAIRCSNG